MKFQVKVEYGREKFVKFYVEADVVDGKVLRYSFSSLVEDIRRTCGSLRHHTFSTLRIRYKDEDGDFVNLNEDDIDNFQHMFVRASSVDETEHMQKLDPRSLESSFANAANPERSPLDYVKAELAENVQLKNVLLSSAKEELVKATAQNEALTPLSAIRSRICGFVQILRSLMSRIWSYKTEMCFTSLSFS